MEIKKIEKTGSTNTWIADHEKELEETCLIYCTNQTAGRGQRGNSWESEPGKNITASLLFHPKDFTASNQFKISEAITLSIIDFLRTKGIEPLVKWPNDIYHGNKKICGILVEHVVVGKNIVRSIAGFGINLNQKKFLGDAPNPVSLTMLTGKEYEIDREIKNLSEFLERRLEDLNRGADLHQEFLDNLWRKDGQFYSFHDKNQKELIRAKIATVSPEGLFRVITDKDEIREFAFKEIEYILEQ